MTTPETCPTCGHDNSWVAPPHPSVCADPFHHQSVEHDPARLLEIALEAAAERIVALRVALGEAVAYLHSCHTTECQLRRAGTHCICGCGDVIERVRVPLEETDHGI